MRVCLFLLLFTSLSSHAQRYVTGQVLEASTTRGVRNARISLIGTNSSVVTDTLGNFSFVSDSPDSILVSANGYASVKYKLPATNNIRISLRRKGDDPIFIVTEEPASFPGGLSALDAHIKKNLRYPDEAKRMKLTGRVFVEFIVDTTGVIMPDRIRIAKSLHPACDAEAIRVFRELPAWIPARQRGRKVKQRMVLPVEFSR